MKDELGEKIMKKIFRIRAKAQSYLTDKNAKDKKEKGAKKFVIKRKIIF